MPERSSLNQIIQIGVEVTPGTSVAATKLLQSMAIEPTFNVEIDQFRPSGQKYKTLTALNREWATASVSGKPTYTEIIYALSSVLDTAVVTTPGGGTLSRTWTFESHQTTDDVPKTFTVEHGSSVRADKFTYGLFTELGLSFSRTAVDLSGSMIAQAITDNITLTPSGVTALPLIPVLPSQVSVYMDSTAAGLGTTKLNRAISAEVSIGSRFGPVWVLDAGESSFVNHIETEPDLTLTLTMQADAEGMAQLGDMRTGTTKFIRIEAVTPTFIEAAIPYRLRVDMACKVADSSGFSDQDGVYAVEWSFVGVTDATWTKSHSVAVTNDITAL